MSQLNKNQQLPDDEKLFNGAEINDKNFKDFVARLHKGVRGEHVKEHATANALFVVQRERHIIGISTDYTDNKCITDLENDATYFSLESFVESLDEDALSYFELNDYETPFLEMTESEQWDYLEQVDQLSIDGYSVEWEYVNCHFTKEAAERFIERKRHDYGKLRVFVDSQYWAWEFRTIVDAILDGKLVYNAEA